MTSKPQIHKRLAELRVPKQGQWSGLVASFTTAWLAFLLTHHDIHYS